jgi:hypothetical protein
MGRPPQEFKTTQTRASIRETYEHAVYKELAKENFFNPTKPAQGDYSKLIQQLIREWLMTKLSKEDMVKLDNCRNLLDLHAAKIYPETD